MKKISILGLLALGVLAFASCGGSKSVTKGRQEVSFPCQEQGKSDKNHFRASATAKSADLNAAKQKAMLNAKQELASRIESTIKSVTENYINEMDADLVCMPGDFFTNVYDDIREPDKIIAELRKIKSRYGKNAILKGTSYTEGATGRERNAQIGGHKA